MKADTPFTHPPALKRLGALACAGMVLLSQAWPAWAGGDKDQTPPSKHRPSVFPIKSRPYGKSYGNWGAAWWAWMLGIPKAQNPNFDPTGEFAHVNQDGPVFFLAGNFGGVNERSISVPAGKALFFPVMNSVYWAPEDLTFVKDVIAPSQGWDLTGQSDADILRRGVNWATDHATALSVTVDGVPVRDPWQYRAESDPFTLELSDALADFGYPPGPRSPNVADGYWIMLRALSPGKHTIRFTSAARYSVADGDPFDQDFSLDVTYHLKVVRPAHIIPPHARYRGLTYGEWGAKWWINMFGTPVVDSQHPYLTGGAFEGERGVVFLAALPGGATIDLTITSGTPLFLPVMNSECSGLEPDPFHGENEAELRACANGHIDHTSGLFLEIDGLPVNHLERYRVGSPLFEFTLPENNLFQFFGLDAPAGTTSPAVDAGVYALLAPLHVGRHTIHVGGTFDQLNFSIDTTFNITVEPRGHGK